MSSNRSVCACSFLSLFIPNLVKSADVNLLLSVTEISHLWCRICHETGGEHRSPCLYSNWPRPCQCWWGCSLPFSFLTPRHLFIFTVTVSAPKNMFSIFSVLVTLLRPRKASLPIESREDLVCPSINLFGPPLGRAGSNRLARLKRLCAGATGLSF